jgi:hypothetical protein
MWILNFLPDWVFSCIFLVGAVGLAITYLLKWIPLPFFYIYKTPIQLVSILLMAIGTFMIGAVWNQNAWLVKVSELEAKMAKAQVQSAKENVKIVEKVVLKKQYYREKGNDIVTYVDREVVKYDDSCKIPKEFVEAINKAAAK